MAEKRKQRSAKIRRTENPFNKLPPSKLEFQKSSSPAVEEANNNNEDGPQRVSDPTAAAQKAQALLRAQRESVNMLTMVRERVEALPAPDILSSLEENGYFMVDDFLKDATILDRLYDEAVSMYEGEEMEVDTLNLGSGEYTTALQGGSEQYIKCPRSVELVVSTTKHIPEVMEGMHLDASACMATLRTFDRKAFKASLALLTGNDDDSDLPPQSEQPFGTVATEENDQRRLTLQYYVLPESWEESCGGGLTFDSGGSVSAKRDRLVIFKSDACALRNEAFRGNERNEIGSFIQLHLVKKAS
jgi:hypothetical protein